MSDQTAVSQGHPFRFAKGGAVKEFGHSFRVVLVVTRTRLEAREVVAVAKYQQQVLCCERCHADRLLIWSGYRAMLTAVS